MRHSSRRGQLVADALRIDVVLSDTLRKRGDDDTHIHSPETPSPSFAPTKLDSPSSTTKSTLRSTFITKTTAASNHTTAPTEAALTAAVSSTVWTTATSVVVITSQVPSTTTTRAQDVKHGVTITSTATSTSLPASAGVGETHGNDTDAAANHRGVSGASIAVGTLGGFALLVSIIILLLKWRHRIFSRCLGKRNNRDGANDDGRLTSNSRPYSATMQQRRATHRSDFRIIDEVITAAYSAEKRTSGNRSEDRQQQQQQQQQQQSEWVNEKQRGFEHDEMPIMRPSPTAKRNKKLNQSVSRWLSRQSSQMLNPMSARASMASSAGGLRALTADWESDDGTSTTESYLFQPLTPPKSQPRGGVDVPAPLKVAKPSVARNADVDLSYYQNMVPDEQYARPSPPVRAASPANRDRSKSSWERSDGYALG